MQDQQQGPEYFERQYNNRLSIPDAADYNKRAEEQSEIARRDLRCTLDVPYGDSPRERIDIFHGNGEAPRPVLVFIHGGYWRSRSKSDFSFVAKPFVEAGVTVAMPTYDLAPTVTVEHIVEQVRTALAKLYRSAAEFGIDRNRIYVAGHSAGGHLAAMMVATDWPSRGADLPADLVKGGYGVSGIYDLMPMLHFSFNKDIRLDADSAKRASALTYRPPQATPFYTAVGALESDEFRRQARDLRGTWPHCHRAHMDVPGAHHLSILETLTNAQSPLFQSVLQMIVPSTPVRRPS